MHPTSCLDLLGVLALTLPQPKRLAQCYSLSTVFLSVNGLRYDISIFKRKEQAFMPFTPVVV
jgi:hypothetical protein